MVVVEMHCTCGAYARVVTSEFALLMRCAQLRRDHEGDGHTVTRSASTSMTGSRASPTDRRVRALLPSS